MHNSLHAHAGTGILLALVACQAAETPEQMQARMAEDAAAARLAIVASQDKWETFATAGQVDSMTAAFTDDATVMPPNQPAVMGREAVRALWQGFQDLGQWTIDLRTGTVVANGPLAVETGTYTLTFKPGPNAPPGMPTADTGKYLAHWRLVDGEWKIAQDTWNSDLPVPQPATRRR